MFNALDINTKVIIATAKTRAAAAEAGAKIAGKEGYCVRPAREETINLPKNWCTTDGEWWM